MTAQQDGETEADPILDVLREGFEAAIADHPYPRQICATDQRLSRDVIEYWDLLSAANLACNPNFSRSLQIEVAKTTCIQTKVCSSEEETNWTEGPTGIECQFSWWDIVRDCGDLDPSLGDKKVVTRHLEAEAKIGQIGKRMNEGKALYFVHPTR